MGVKWAETPSGFRSFFGYPLGVKRDPVAVYRGLNVSFLAILMPIDLKKTPYPVTVKGGGAA